MDLTTRKELARVEFTAWAGQGECFDANWADHLVPLVDRLIREARAEAFDEGYDTGADPDSDGYPGNPYRD